MTEEQISELKAFEFNKWCDTKAKWLHFQLSLGRVYEVMSRAFYEGVDIGIETKYQDKHIAELEKEATAYALEWGDKTDGTYACCRDGYLAGAEPREKRIAELEKEISVLLSCKNCPENKGGYICEKEYENKCLAQKIQFIKELQEENAELKKEVEKHKWNDIFLEENAVYDKK